MKGFTLIELVVVLAILGTLAGILAPMLVPFAEDAREQAWETERDLIQSAVDQYRVTEGSKPIDEDDDIDFALIVGKGYLFETPETQLTSYTWYMKTNGKVQSYLKTDDTKEGFQELFP